MSDYLFINSFSKKGKMGISHSAFDALISSSLSGNDEYSLSKSHLKKNQKFILNRPIQTTISRGILHISLKIDIRKNVNIQETCQKIQNEISAVILAATDQIPFDVQVKVISIY